MEQSDPWRMAFYRHSGFKAAAIWFITGWLAMAQPAVSTMVGEDGSGSLTYGTYANQGQANSVNTVPDFSGAGYKGGGVSVPFIPAVVTIAAPSGGDDTALIQNAVNQVAAMPLQGNGFRGAVLIKAGNYQVASTITISASGIVIRGEGQGSGGTRITMTATAQDNLFEFGGSGYYPAGSNTATIADAHVPTGAKSFNVTNAAGYAAGDEIRLVYKMNQKWIEDIGMDNIYDPVELRDESWTPAEFQLTYDRRVASVVGNTVHIETPLVQAIENQYGGATVSRLGASSGRISHVGIEALRLESTYLSDTDEAHGWVAIVMSDVENAWVRQTTAKYFGMGCVKISSRCRNITIEDSAMVDPKSITDGGRKYSFSIDDCTSVLVQRCYTWGGRHDYVSGSLTPGPNVFVDSLSENAKDDVGPHFRYATGELYDNIKSTDINVQNRWDWGTGHGWSGAQVMFWNCVASKIACVTPVGGMNWAIGCIGTKSKGRISTEPYGIWESQYAHVTPRSLYYRQLQERMGGDVLRNVILPQQAAGPVWNALAAWAGEGLFLDPLVAWGGGLVRPLGSTASLKGVVRDLKMLDRGITVTWSKVSGPGTVTFGNAAALETTASFSAQGEYALRLLVNDGVTQRSVDVTITALTENNQAPVASAQAVTMDQDTARTITLSGFDWDGDSITFAIQNNPAHGTLAGTPPNLIYTPNAGYSGADSFTFTASDGTHVSTPATVIITVVGIDPNLVAHWKFDETSGLSADDASAPDGAPGEHDGTLVNMTGNEWDGIGALAFDGVSDNMVATGFKGVTGATARTVMAWIKTTVDGPIVAWGTDATSQKYIFRLENGQLRIEVNGGFLKSTSLVNDGAWHHVALVFPSGATNVTQHLFYIDGAPDASYNPISKSVSTASGIDLLVGKDHSNRYFSGMMDDVRVYNRALAAAEIAALAGARPMPQNSRGLLEFIAADFSQAEEDSGTSWVTIAVERRDGFTGAASVNYTTSDGTATLANDDYVAASGTLGWADGELGIKTFTVPIHGDVAVETDETIQLVLSNVSGAVYGGRIQSTVTILDDDLPTVQVAATDNAASETGPNPGVWTISRMGHTSSDLTVHYSLGGTATAGSDYTASPPSPVTIPAGQHSVTVTLTPVDDSVFGEPDETAVLTITPSANHAVGSAAATVTLTEGSSIHLSATGASALSSTGATLNGTLLQGGPADLTVVWDTIDKGTTPGAWASSKVLPGQPNGAFSTDITGLTQGVSYVYRIHGASPLFSGWSQPSTFTVPSVTSAGIRHQIRGESQSSTATLGYLSTTTDMVGISGSSGSRSDTNVVFGFTLPTLPAGTTLAAATFQFEITHASDNTGAENLPDLQVYLLNTVNPAGSGNTFFYHGPLDPNPNVEQVGTTRVTITGTSEVAFPAGQEVRSFTLSGDALALLQSYYNNQTPTRSTAYFRFNLSEDPITSVFRRYRVSTAAAGSSLQLFSVAPLSAPQNLVATAGNASVGLSWNAVAGGGSYEIKRSTQSGGPYATIATSTNTSHTDNTVTNGSTYYYVVSAANNLTAGPNSTQASAMPFLPGALATSSGMLAATGRVGGSFSPSSIQYTLSNPGGMSINWTASKTAAWVSLSASSGTLAAGANTIVTVSINSQANALAAGGYNDTITFTNTTNGGGDTTRTVTITVRSLFEEWAGGNGLTGNHAEAGSDPDRDGLTNLHEYAFGLNPSSSVRRPLNFVIGGDLTEPGLPVLMKLPVQGEPDALHAVFTRRREHVAAGITYRVEFSADLMEWTAASNGLSVEAQDTTGDMEAVSVPFPATVLLRGGLQSAPPKFFRVVVSTN